ncbi:unnamed protein product [Paramecium sonneborni]|uniref:PARP catalytic domain-containing protein n=1 Tax=Paramecium sonneborni TaxID=65129 RepID=A0A8S1R420_9CILI|nr:unnamed protein product [Paramecium sonneborni]
MEQFSHIRFIINIKLNSLQNYNYNNLKQCIEKLFERIKDNSQIKSLAIPLFFQDDIQGKEEIVQQYLQIIINKFFEAKNLQRKIYITENNPQKTDIINKALIRIYLHPNMDNFNGNGKMTKVMRTIMNKIMNKQMKHISHFYKQIMKQDQFEKINFKRQKILYQYKLTVTYNRGVEQYFINGEQIESELNQYLCQQKKNNCFEFDIFWKCLLVIINQYYINQINLQTNYSRQIRKIQSTILFGENFKFSDSINSSQSQENQFQIESFNSKQNDKILQKLKEEFQKSVIKLNIQIPQIKKDKLKNLYNYFDQVALNKIEDFTQGKKIVIEIFKKNQSKFLNQIGFIENFGKNYPKKWISQNDNCVKVPLNMSSLEFIKVQNHFCQSDFGNIKAIFRIQNKILWNNYVNERNKLIELYQSQGYNLNKIERKRFLWHGVKNEHPKKIYEGEKEGFDCSYSNKNSSWGPGINELIIFVIYFAENACYSRNYSYELKYDDDQQYVGLKVFLCCLVTTGKTELRNPDPNILRPNDDYDCVTGTSNESEIFVLYQMDVRRAYLAYEVIFE